MNGYAAIRHAANDHGANRHAANHHGRTPLLALAAVCVLGLALDGGGALAAPTDTPRVVRFVNDADEKVSLLVVDHAGGGQVARVIAPGAALEIRTEAAALGWSVRGAAGWSHGGRLALDDLRRREVHIERPGGHLRVRNRSGETLSLTFDDEPLAALPADAERALGPLPAGKHTLLLQGRHTRTLFRQDVEVAPGRVREVVVRGLGPPVELSNPLDVPATLVVDRRRLGSFEPGAVVVVTGLPGGQHEVAWQGAGGRKATGSVATSADRAAGADPMTGAVLVRVENATGEALGLPPALADLRDVALPDGTKETIRLDARPTRLILIGERSGLTYARDLRGDEGSLSWRIERPTATLELVNPTPEAASVVIDGRPAVQVGAQGKLRVRGVPAGQIRVAASMASGELIERGLRLEPEGFARWELIDKKTQLVVRSGWSEPVALTVDGAPRGRVPPHGALRIEGLKPGLHRVDVEAVVTGRKSAADVVVHATRPSDLSLQPPYGALELRNDGEHTLAVVARGKEVGRVAPGASFTHLLEPGEIAVEVRDVETGANAPWKGRLAPGQQMPLPQPRAWRGTVYVENTSGRALEAIVDGRDATPISPGARVRFDGLVAGARTVVLRRPGAADKSAPTRVERLQLREGDPPVVVRVGPSER